MTLTKVSLPQSSLNALIQCLNSVGWAKTPFDVYNAGRLLSEVLPELDTTWIKSDGEVAGLTPAERIAYRAYDLEFAAKVVEVELSDKDRDLIRACLKETAVRLPPGKYSAKLLFTFGFSS